ncbi:uncharacterized protein MELLADRAFT_60030 [Melampsora larici-populina 98AG31]|uniref:Uncharacterized protein n=1 Tax=Melampsora larici-populina (strain 98AG31 / pathotype 3-4-7) TaxID=747676 RepID=F4R9Q1_MELLP|nr:uncharacterized protein MELLADRAFT_60030 [Melampsora larici-populina 98AG31]EGG11019.1 hypothetical protein MELLADRAFT_60030 [Melampsora larici-populina 98AG31]
MSTPDHDSSSGVMPSFNTQSAEGLPYTNPEWLSQSLISPSVTSVAENAEAKHSINPPLDESDPGLRACPMSESHFELDQSGSRYSHVTSIPSSLEPLSETFEVFTWRPTWLPDRESWSPRQSVGGTYVRKPEVVRGIGVSLRRSGGCYRRKLLRVIPPQEDLIADCDIRTSRLLVTKTHCLYTENILGYRSCLLGLSLHFSLDKKKLAGLPSPYGQLWSIVDAWNLPVQVFEPCSILVAHMQGSNTRKSVFHCFPDRRIQGLEIQLLRYPILFACYIYIQDIRGHSHFFLPQAIHPSQGVVHTTGEPTTVHHGRDTSYGLSLGVNAYGKVDLTHTRSRSQDTTSSGSIFSSGIETNKLLLTLQEDREARDGVLSNTQAFEARLTVISRRGADFTVDPRGWGPISKTWTMQYDGMAELGRPTLTQSPDGSRNLFSVSNIESE